MTKIIANLLAGSSNDIYSFIAIVIIAGLLLLLGIYLSIHYLVQKHTNKVLLEKVLNNPNSTTRSATFVKSKYLYGIVQPMKGTAYYSGIPYHYIYVKYIDDNGLERVARVKHMISDHDLRYIKCLETIKIKTYENFVAIAEDLSNTEITDEMLIEVQRRTGDTSHVKPPYYVSTATGKFMVGLVLAIGLGALGSGIAQIVFAVKNPDNMFTYILIAVFSILMAGSACFVLYMMLCDVIVDKFGTVHTGALQSVKWEYKNGKSIISEKVAYVLIDGKSERVVLGSQEEYMFLAHYVGKNIGVRQIGKKIVIDYDSLGEILNN